MRENIARFLARTQGVTNAGGRCRIEPVAGGLEAAVFHVRLSPRRDAGLPRRIVVKRLRGLQPREAAIYRTMSGRSEKVPLVRYLGSEPEGDMEYLYLEYVEPAAWPWAEVESAAAVCQILADLHRRVPLGRSLLGRWDYEAELCRSAQETVAVAESVRDEVGRRWWRRPGDLRRVVAALPNLRNRLLATGVTVIHGDLHPGNVLLRRGAAGADERVALLDWARARLGSPWEDVASWLHSLGCWEPTARRRHDALLRVYLGAAGKGKAVTALTAEVRALYWYACASNGLSGAIRYHLAVLGNVNSPLGLRDNARRALAEWQRVMKRVAAMLATSPCG